MLLSLEIQKETYYERLKTMQTQSSEGSTSNLQEIDPATKVQCWKDVTGGKSRGRYYGTADLAANIRHGVSSLTQPSVFAGNIDEAADTQGLREQIIRATARATAAEERATATDQRCSELEEKLKLMQQQLAMVIDRQMNGSSTSTSQVHPHYAQAFDDQPLD